MRPILSFLIGICVSVAGLSLSSIAAETRFIGEEILSLAGTEFDKATGSQVVARINELFDRLEVPTTRRSRYAYANFAKYVRYAEYFEAAEVTETVIVARKSVSIGFATNVVVIAGGDVHIAHGNAVVVVSNGTINVSHESAELGGKEPGGIYVTKNKVEIAHAHDAILYAVRGAEISHSGKLSAHNTDVKSQPGALITKYVRPPLFSGEPVRTPIPPRMLVFSGETIRYSGMRCEHGVEEFTLFERMLPIARREGNCPRIESAAVRCDHSDGAGLAASTRERWTFRLCDQTLEIVVNKQENSSSFAVDRTGLRATTGKEPLAYGSAPKSGRPERTSLSVENEATISKLITTALAHLLKGELTDARVTYSKVLEIAPDHQSARESRDSLDERIAAADAAAAQFTDLIRNNRATARTYADRGRAYVDAGDAGRALADLNKAMAMDVSDPRNALELAATYLRTNRLDEAAATAGDLIGRNPRLSSAYAIRAWANLLKNRPEEAYKDAFSSMVEAPTWTPTSWATEAASYRVLCGYFALRQSAPRSNAAGWLQQWKANLSKDTWPDAMLSYLLGELDERDVHAIAESLRKADRGVAAAEATVFMSLERGYSGEWDEGRRRMNEYFAVRYGAGYTLPWLIQTRSSTPGQALNFRR